MKKQLQQDLKDLAREIISENQAMSTKALQQKVAVLYQKVSVLVYLEGQIDGDDAAKNDSWKKLKISWHKCHQNRNR